jgi:small subunit ribosomal protein S6
MVVKKASKQALKAEEVQLCDYELVVIISPEVADEKLEAMIDNISKFITERGGVISSVDRWGKRKLAYPIKHFVEGNYVLAQFKSKAALGKELEARLQILEEVVRHLLIKLGS